MCIVNTIHLQETIITESSMLLDKYKPLNNNPCLILILKKRSHFKKTFIEVVCASLDACLKDNNIITCFKMLNPTNMPSSKWICQTDAFSNWRLYFDIKVRLIDLMQGFLSLFLLIKQYINMNSLHSNSNVLWNGGNLFQWHVGYDNFEPYFAKPLS